MAEYEVPEKTENRRERSVGLIIACIAVILAIVSALGHDCQNEKILAHVDASDQYNFYQAKKNRDFQLELATDRIQSTPGEAAESAEILKKYADQRAKLNGDLKEIQAKGDEFMKDADRLAKKSRVLDIGEIALQISIVLCSITILTEQRLFTAMGATTAAIGIAVALWGILMG